MKNNAQASCQAEEQLIAELARLGLSFISRNNTDSAQQIRAPHELLAGLVSQPSSRVRTALIALLLARPDYAKYVPRALESLSKKDAQTLRFLYTAAVYLQQEYREVLHKSIGSRWRKLPNMFSDELGLIGNSPAARLEDLARLHAEWSGEKLNWAGTYENAARHLLRRWEMEHTWKA